MKPFPWECQACGALSVVPVVSSYESNYIHDGRLFQVKLDSAELYTCAECGFAIIPDKTASMVVENFFNQSKLITGGELRFLRIYYGLTPYQLAGYLDVPTTTVDSWERGTQIQSFAMDRLLKTLFTAPDVLKMNYKGM